jgi:hypothetical protein
MAATAPRVARYAISGNILETTFLLPTSMMDQCAESVQTAAMRGLQYLPLLGSWRCVMTDKLLDVWERKLTEMQRPIACGPSDYEEGCRDGYNEALDELRAFLAQYVLCELEPFGYFKAEPFGWTDCAENDEGAMALYTPAKGVE